MVTAVITHNKPSSFESIITIARQLRIQFSVFAIHNHLCANSKTTMSNDISEQYPEVTYPHWEKYFMKQPNMVLADGYCVLPRNSSKMAGKLKKFPVRPDDTWVISFPKSGTTWTQEIVYLLKTGCDIQKARTLMDERFPFLEADLFYATPIRGDQDVLTCLANSFSPRFIKSHLPYEMLPDGVKEQKCKIVYVARNPKDVMVSFYFFYKMLTSHNFTGQFADFVELFLNDKLIFTPYWKNIFSYWERRNQDNILFIHYEDLQADFPNEVEKIAAFLGNPLTSEELAIVGEHCSFPSMKENPATNKDYWKDVGRWKEGGTKFMRKGEVGDWTNHFTPEMANTVNRWIQANIADTGYTFREEL